MLQFWLPSSFPAFLFGIPYFVYCYLESVPSFTLWETEGPCAFSAPSSQGTNHDPGWAYGTLPHGYLILESLRW